MIQASRHFYTLFAPYFTVQNWFLLLKEDEAFVTQRHLVDGIDWPRTALEYKARWGDNYEKTERTLKNYQQRALRKIVAFTKAHPETLDRYCG